MYALMLKKNQYVNIGFFQIMNFNLAYCIYLRRPVHIMFSVQSTQYTVGPMHVLYKSK